ncbi:MAG: amidohydrolase family protein [Bacteroidetes bacterium]|nr:amidohydrolase family protein [Bacteroidota bacterium]
MHTHLLPPDMPLWAEKFGYGDFIWLAPGNEGRKRMMKGNQFFREIGANCWDPELRIEEYARFQTQVQVVCTIPVMFSYWAKPHDCLEMSRFLNDHLAEIQATYPKHYLALGTVPMQDAKLAISELERLVSLGVRGIQIGSNINNNNLGDPEFFPIFEACEQLNLAVMVHPWNMMGFEYMTKYWLPWLVGMPAETSRAMCSMIFSGVLEKLPNLRVNFSHAGGSFMGTIGRIEHGFNCRPDLVAVDNARNPREYLGQFWVDSITHDPRMLEYIMDLQGTRRVCLGSDYPFPLGDLEIGRMIEGMQLPENTVEDLFHNATMEWLDLDPDYFSAPV